MAFFWLRFHALVKMLSDYQSVTKDPVAASRRWTLTTGAFWQWFGRAPARVEPLEVRFAHPVRLSPDTHSQGHGRPCLHDPATARACLAEGITENGVSVKTSGLVWPGVRVKTFSAHVVVVFRLVVSRKRFSTHGRVRGNREIGEKRE